MNLYNDSVVEAILAIQGDKYYDKVRKDLRI